MRSSTMTSNGSVLAEQALLAVGCVIHGVASLAQALGDEG